MQKWWLWFGSGRGGDGDMREGGTMKQANIRPNDRAICSSLSQPYLLLPPEGIRVRWCHELKAEGFEGTLWICSPLKIYLS